MSHLLKYWLVSDVIAQDFAFRLNGFDFLFDKVIGAHKIDLIEEEKPV